MARNCFSALDLESDSEPKFDPEPLSRSCFRGERTVPSHFGAFGLEQQTFEPENLEVSISTELKTQHLKQNHQPTILVLKKEPKQPNES